jgi:hypothetical protein
MDDAYWRKRHQHFGSDIRAVGHAGKAPAANMAEYSVSGNLLGRLLAEDFPEPAGVRVFEVGFGQGHHARILQGMGFQDYLGIDLASPHRPDIGPGFRFRQGDVTRGAFGLENAEEAPGPGTVDLVLLMDVMFHIIGDVNFQVGVRTVGEVVKEGGKVYATGWFRNWWDTIHATPWVRHRTLEAFTPLGVPLDVHPWRDVSLVRFRGLPVARKPDEVTNHEGEEQAQTRHRHD